MCAGFCQGVFLFLLARSPQPDLGVFVFCLLVLFCFVQLFLCFLVLFVLWVLFVLQLWMQLLSSYVVCTPRSENMASLQNNKTQTTTKNTKPTNTLGFSVVQFFVSCCFLCVFVVMLDTFTSLLRVNHLGMSTSLLRVTHWQHYH